MVVHLVRRHVVPQWVGRMMLVVALDLLKRALCGVGLHGWKTVEETPLWVSEYCPRRGCREHRVRST